MRIIRNGLVCAIVVVMTTGLAIPALAGQDGTERKGNKKYRLVTYVGKTSAGERFRVDVIKDQKGRRHLSSVILDFTVTCEDGKTEDWGIGIGWGRGPKLRKGAFTYGEDFWDASEHLSFKGVIRAKKGHGSFDFREARLNEDLETAQVCRTGELTWNVKRTGSVPLTSFDATRDTYRRFTHGNVRRIERVTD